MQNGVLSTRMTSLYGFQPPPGVLCMQNSVIITRNTSLYVSQPSSVVLCTQNSAFMTRITRLYGSQTSPVDLCMQNSVLITRIKCLNRSQTSPVDLCMQKQHAYHWSLWVPDLTCGFAHSKQRAFQRTYKSIWVPAHICGFYMKNRDLGPELQVYLGPSPHLWFSHEKQRLRTRIASLYVYHTSPTIVCKQNGVLSIRITSLY